VAFVPKYHTENMALYIINLGTTWNCMVSFTFQPLYLQVECTQYPLDRGRQSQSEHGGEEKNSLLCQESNLSCPAHNQSHNNNKFHYNLLLLYTPFFRNHELILWCNNFIIVYISSTPRSSINIPQRHDLKTTFFSWGQRQTYLTNFLFSFNKRVG
jgi:hypothetical protein